MNHLSEEHLLELLEGETTEAGHLDTCATCRERLGSLRDTLGLVRDDPIPEPSPLFWQHLSERVRLAIDAESADVRKDGWLQPATWMRRRWRWVAAAAVVVLVGLVSVTSWQIEQTGNGGERSASIGSPSAEVRDDLGWTTPTDDSWAMVAGLAEGLDFEAAAEAGLIVRPGSVDQALSTLSDEERRDLAGIIQAELAQSPL
jgi:hypothetical protein